MANKTFDIATIVTNQIIEALEKGTIPWKKPWKTLTPMNLITKHEYQGINLLLLSLSDQSSPYYLTFKQLQYLGGSLKQGTKGYRVIYWKVIEYKRKTKDNEIERLEIPMMRYYTVFNIEQCFGIPENKIPKETNNFKPIKTCEDIVNNMPGKPHIIAAQSSYYYRSMDTIGIPDKDDFTSEEEYYSTLFHEIVHSTGHVNRLNRFLPLSAYDAVDEYSEEELIAELGNAYLCAHTHISPKTIDNQTGYINHWLSRLNNNKRLLIKASSAAKKAVDYILGTREKDE